MVSNKMMLSTSVFINTGNKWYGENNSRTSSQLFFHDSNDTEPNLKGKYDVHLYNVHTCTMCTMCTLVQCVHLYNVYNTMYTFYHRQK